MDDQLGREILAQQREQTELLRRILTDVQGIWVFLAFILALTAGQCGR